MAGSGALAAKILNKSPPANRLGAKKASGLRAALPSMKAVIGPSCSNDVAAIAHKASEGAGEATVIAAAAVEAFLQIDEGAWKISGKSDD